MFLNCMLPTANLCLFECEDFGFWCIMATRKKEQAEETRTQVIKTSTSFPMDDRENVAVFRVEEARREEAGEEPKILPVPDKGRVQGAKVAKKPMRVVSREPSVSGTSAPVGPKH